MRPTGKSGTLNAAIFDLNGTLYWDTAMHNAAWDLFLEKYRIRLSDHEKHQKMHGRTNREILRAVFDPDISDGEADVLSLEKEALYREIADRRGVVLADGAAGLFDDLTAAGVPFTIATASEKVNLDFYFDRLRLDRWFDYNRVVYNDLTMPSKPDPTMYIRAAEVLAVAPDHCVVFEDSIAGIQAAANAGAGRVIVVNSNNERYPDFAFQVIRSFREVDRSMFRPL